MLVSKGCWSKSSSMIERTGCEWAALSDQGRTSLIPWKGSWGQATSMPQPGRIRVDGELGWIRAPVYEEARADDCNARIRVSRASPTTPVSPMRPLLPSRPIPAEDRSGATCLCGSPARDDLSRSSPASRGAVRTLRLVSGDLRSTAQPGNGRASFTFAAHGTLISHRAGGSFRRRHCERRTSRRSVVRIGAGICPSHRRCESPPKGRDGSDRAPRHLHPARSEMPLRQ